MPAVAGGHLVWKNGHAGFFHGAKYDCRMHQFPSVVKRRRHVEGHGLYQQYPQPAAPVILADPDQWEGMMPPLPPFIMVGMIRRYLAYLGQYTAIAARYKGEDACDKVAFPAGVDSDGQEEAANNLMEAVVEAGDHNPHSSGPVVGGSLYIPNEPTLSGVVSAADPNWTLYAYLDRTMDRTTCPAGWLVKEDGCLAIMDATYPGGTYSLQAGDGSTGPFNYPENGTTYRPGAWADSRGDVTLTGYIYAVLWGCIPAPTCPEYPGIGAKHTDAGDYQDEFLAMIGRTAARIVWQMAWLEIAIMQDDFLLTNKGGRGGKPLGPVGELSPIMFGPPIPNVPLNQDGNPVTIMDAINAAADNLKVNQNKIFPVGDPNQQ